MSSTEQSPRPDEADFTDEPSPATFSEVEKLRKRNPWSKDRHQEWTRTTLALIAVVALCAVIAMAIVFPAVGYLSVDETLTLYDRVLATAGTLAGTVLGFYFGRQ